MDLVFLIAILQAGCYFDKVHSNAGYGFDRVHNNTGYGFDTQKLLNMYLDADQLLFLFFVFFGLLAYLGHCNMFLQVLYLSGKVPPNIPFLVELTCKVSQPGVKCAVKTPTVEMAPLFFEAIESLLK